MAVSTPSASARPVAAQVSNLQPFGVKAVDTSSVAGRRELAFRGLDEVLADATALVAAGQVKTLGNWPVPQLLTHLASTINNSIDGFQSKAPLFIRIIGPLLKHRMLKKMPPGIKLPADAEKSAFPAAASSEDALKQLRLAISRCKLERMNAAHPAFGKMTHEQWLQLHLRHSELHLSFILPS